jgi:hypothetical protein
MRGRTVHRYSIITTRNSETIDTDWLNRGVINIRTIQITNLAYQYLQSIGPLKTPDYVPAVQPGASGTNFHIGYGYQMVTFDMYP